VEEKVEACAISRFEHSQFKLKSKEIMKIGRKIKGLKRRILDGEATRSIA
jgi:hypothetical protein